MDAPRLIRFVRRYWILIVLWLCSLVVMVNNAVFGLVKTLVFVPTYALTAMLVALLIRNVFNVDTTDRDSDTGRFVQDWNDLDPKTRAELTVKQMGTYFLGVCLIAAALLV